MRLRSLPSPVDLGRFWFMLALAAVGVGNMGFHVIVSRLMGPAEYGAFGSLLALMVLVTVPAGGVQTLITARTARIVESGRLVDGTAAFGRFRRAGAICAIAMLAAAPLLQGFLRLDSIWPICWLALYCLFPVAIVVPWGWLCGQGKFAVVGTIAIAGTVIRISVGILLIQAGFGVSGAIMASVAADSCQLVALYLASNRVRARDRARAVSLGIDPRAAIGGVLAVTGLWLLVGADTIAARHFLDPVSAGRYSATATVLHGALYGAQALTAALLPSFATRNLRNSRTALTRALLGTAILTIPAMVLLTLVGPRLIPLVLGATFQVSTDVIALVAVATTGLALLWVLVQHAMASSRHGANIVWLGLPLVVGGAALWHTQMWTLAAVTVVAVAVPLALLGWRSLIARPPATGRVPERWRDAVPFACTNGGHSTATAYDKMKRFHEEPSDSYRGRADQERREDVGTMPGKRESPDISLC